MFTSTSSSASTAVGSNALYNSTGGANSAFGASALQSVTTGTLNTGLGNGADVTVGTLTNATAIGAGATVNASNKVRIGNTSVTVIEGQVVFSFPSDARFKYNIKDNVPGLDFIKRLTPVTYYFDGEKLGEFTKTGIISNNIIKPASYGNKAQLHTGFLAQEVEKIANELGYQFDGVHAPVDNKDHYSLACSQFIMPLVKSVQEQQQIIEAQDKKINIQQQQINKMNEQLEELAKAVKALSSK